MHPGIPVGYLSFALLLASLVEKFNIVIKIMASMFLVKLEGFSRNDCASLLEVVAENFSRLAALLNSDGLFCSGPHYLLAQGLGLGFAYFTCRVLSLCIEW